ncbi:hypothetical protein [Labilibaculum euxinus]|uniref:Uncharacterized protein n=1 Tax=Labilibaculum euxinus TaxID=2686357 RepID=A0A7M4D0W0_9BACT|nr:hypothetical protein [Labilibaculum euxinus]MUP36289.1 hypothetical protein [Labilibaculum euxinus]MVB05494.1 hypothetical protein [Labilibaculum euxinus]
MREICVPIPLGDDNEVAEVEVKLANKKISVFFRLESFSWDVSKEIADKSDDITEKLLKIYNLKKLIADYDSDWELIQIFTPSESSKNIQVLFRKK